MPLAVDVIVYCITLLSPEHRLDDNHGVTRSSRPDGRRGVAALGPAYGAERHLVRVWPRFTPCPDEGFWEPFRGVRRRVWVTATTGAAQQQGMIESFAAKGMVGLVSALAIMLRANVGTTFIVAILSFNLSAIPPVLFVLRWTKLYMNSTRDDI